MEDLRVATIQRKHPVHIKVNGREIPAYKGESLMAALIAAGIKTLRESSMIKHLRGGFCGMGVCYECLVTINGIPNQRACMVSVDGGMEVEIHEG